MEVKNGEQPRFPSKRDADLSPSAPTTTIDFKRQKLEAPEEGEEDKKASRIPNEEQTVAAATTENERTEEGEGEAVAGGNVELDNSNGKAVIDRKGKGVLIEEEGEEDEEEEDDSDDDNESSDDGNFSDGSDDSDFVDDPLAEVDLDNILPSKIRRRVVHPGAYICNDLDDDTDDSDA